MITVTATVLLTLANSFSLQGEMCQPNITIISDVQEVRKMLDWYWEEKGGNLPMALAESRGKDCTIWILPIDNHPGDILDHELGHCFGLSHEDMGYKE